MFEGPARNIGPVQSHLRFLFYSHDAVGSGHMRRHLAVAGRLAEINPDASVLFAVGRDQVSQIGLPPGVDVIKLPELPDAAGARQCGMSGAEALTLRASVLQTLVRSYRPGVMVVDKHPLGASGELRPALIALRAMGGRAVLGLRDVADGAGSARPRWSGAAHEAIERHYDDVFVYGVPTVPDASTAREWPAGMAERVRYCGYVVSDFAAQTRREDSPPPFLARRRSRPLVLATAGSGDGAETLLGTFLEAAREAPWDAAIVTGPMSRRADFERFRERAAGAGVDCLESVPGLGRWFGAVDALVTTPAYNLVIDALASGLPAVCVPGAGPRADHLIRARSFAGLGLLRLVEPARLSALTLRRSVDLALLASREAIAERARRVLDLDGADHAAQHLLELAARREATMDQATARPARQARA